MDYNDMNVVILNDDALAEYLAPQSSVIPAERAIVVIPTSSVNCYLNFHTNDGYSLRNIAGLIEKIGVYKGEPTYSPFRRDSGDAVTLYNDHYKVKVLDGDLKSALVPRYKVADKDCARDAKNIIPYTMAELKDFAAEEWNDFFIQAVLSFKAEHGEACRSINVAVGSGDDNFTLRLRLYARMWHDIDIRPLKEIIDGYKLNFQK